MTEKNVFVTVGTTKFDELIETVTQDKILRIFSNLGYNSITLQIGNGTYEPQQSSIIKITYYRLKSTIKEDIQNSNLVISHAGAGSCFEILKANKPLIAVVNEKLMGNHQLELAKAFFNRQYLLYCTCTSLENTLLKGKFNNLKTYEPDDSKKFVEYLDKCVGFYN